MRIAYFDLVGGASGDMLLSALVDAGAAEDVVRSIPAALQLPEYDVNWHDVQPGVGLAWVRHSAEHWAAQTAQVQPTTFA